eukprot:CAMPEP_0184695800 /NCGR_PEP_ID=MMETSP0313-20130426/3324_1 /TAXON_ID=2792 /ORGANISM="Porphyridium aerugineum, Strain SAG 1380-2" /LENGTH=618 /DNA_ID=CAMNT_0027154325 /DNA_START=224 /DNA_END=2080 /DNA_ORIENTATION=+
MAVAILVVAIYLATTISAYPHMANLFRATTSAEITQEAPSAGDHFGYRISVSNETMAVIAQYGDEHPSNQPGSLFIFNASIAQNEWFQVQEIKAPADLANYFFGESVSIYASWIVVGAPSKSEDTAGKVLMYQYKENTWIKRADIASLHVNVTDYMFGWAVALFENTLVISSPTFPERSGLIHVFKYIGTTWQFDQFLQPSRSDLQLEDFFGYSLALTDDWLIVGAPGVNNESGCVYTFKTNEFGQFSQSQRLLSTFDNQLPSFLGTSVAAFNLSMIAGAPLDTNDNSAENATQVGAVYVYRLGSTWVQSKRVFAPEPAATQYFGISVSIDQESFLVGVDPDDNTTESAAYRFAYEGGAWSYAETLVPVGGLDYSTGYATSVGQSNGRELVNGPDSNDGTGAVYYFYDNIITPGPSVTVTPTPKPSNGPSNTTSDPCFPADALVELSNGAMKRMDEVQIGDRVKVAAGKYSQVYFFGHRLADGMFDFVQLGLENGKQLELSKGHLVLSNNAWTRGEDVKQGDLLMDVTEGRSVAVVSITQVRKNGLYNPHTLDGEIVVNGIQASTYTEVLHPRLAHLMLLPERLLYVLFNRRVSLLRNSFDARTPDIVGWMIPRIKSF